MSNQTIHSDSNGRLFSSVKNAARKKRSTREDVSADGRSPIIFPMGTTTQADGAEMAKKTNLANPSGLHSNLVCAGSSIVAAAQPAFLNHASSRDSYTVPKLRAAIARSTNASDHISRIHVVAIFHCDQQPNKGQILGFLVEDSAIPGLKNTLVLEYMGRSAGLKGRHASDSNENNVARSRFNRTGLFNSLKQPFIFHISKASPTSASLESLCNLHPHKVVSMVGGATFPLESLLVVASVACSRHFRNRAHEEDLDDRWPLLVIWDSIRDLTKLNDGQFIAGFDCKLKKAGVLEVMNKRFSRNLMKFRREVIESEQVRNLPV